MAKLNILAIFSVFLFGIALVSGFGVTTPFMENDLTEVAPGETTIINLQLQNMAGEQQDILAIAELTSGSEIATLTEGTEYDVPFGRKDINVPLRISIPENASAGTEYSVSVMFKQTAKDEGKMMQMTSGVSTSFTVRVGGEIPVETPKGGFPWVWTILGILAAAAIIYFTAKKRK